MSDPTEQWKDRFTVCLCCQDCNTVYEVERSSLSLTLELTAKFTRMIVFPVPEGCPKCRNLKVVEPRCTGSGCARDGDCPEHGRNRPGQGKVI